MVAESERRKYVRMDARYIVRCERYPIIKNESVRAVEATTKNVSAGGILFESGIAFVLGDSLRIELRLPGWRDFAAALNPPMSVESDDYVVIGAVVRMFGNGGKYQIGVSFAEMDKNVRWALMKYIYEKVDGE